jgi:hypothetical protein
LRGAFDGCQAHFDVVGSRGPGRYADSHRRAIVPFRAPAPADTVALNLVDDRTCGLVCAERDEHLIDHDVIQDVKAPRAKSVGETPRVRARALDEIGEPAAAQRPEHRPQFDPSCPS